MPGHAEPVRVGQLVGQVCVVRHVGVEHASAGLAFQVVMGRRAQVVTVGAVRNLHAQNLATLCKHAKIPVYRGARNVRMLCVHDFVDVRGGGVRTVQRPHCIHHERALHGVARGCGCLGGHGHHVLGRYRRTSPVGGRSHA